MICETCLSSFNRPQVGACRFERALTNVEPLSEVWRIPTRFYSLGVTILQTSQFWRILTGTQALMCFLTFSLTPHLSCIYPGMFRGKSESI